MLKYFSFGAIALSFLAFTASTAFSQSYGTPQPGTTNTPPAPTSTYTPAPGYVPPSFKVYNSTQYGSYLTNDKDKSVYIYGADTKGSGVSNCYDTCAAAWPPVLAPNANYTPPSYNGTNQSYYGTLQRRDGSYQVTYNGWPLYYYQQDQSPYEAKGQNVYEYGGYWYLIKPDGTRVQ